MKKIIVLIVLILIPFTVSAETVIKIGVAYACGKVEEVPFKFPSAEVKFEQSLVGGLGIGLGLRKETSWGYGGYHFSLYPMYKMKLDKNWFAAVSVGVEYGLDTKYNWYHTEYDSRGNLLKQKWIHAIQNVGLIGDKVKGDTGNLYRFTTFSLGRVWKRVFVEAGLKLQTLRFAVESCRFTRRGRAQTRSYIEKKIWVIIPSIQLSIGYKL